MKKVSSVLFVLFFSAGLASANVGVSKISFTTDVQTIGLNEISARITIQTQDMEGNSVNISQTGCLKLETNSPSGEFSSNNTSWNPVENLTMNKGTANRNFYYKDSTAGDYILIIKGALVSCSDWTAESWTASQNIIISSSQSSSLSSQISSFSYSSAQSQTSTNTENASVWTEELQIYASAGEDKTTVVGADILFEGKALGFKKEPLENARYLWNFGDGTSAEGKNALHYYRHPGDYLAILDVSSGQYSVSDRINVKVIPNQLQIIDANSEFIKLKNKTSLILDISSWFLAKSGSVFKFPQSSFIAANAELIISTDISKIKVSAGETTNLLFPNGSVAFEYKKEIATKSNPAQIYKDTADKVFQLKTTATTVNYSSSSIQNSLSKTSPYQPEDQSANIIYATNPGDSSSKKWLYLAIGLGIFSGGGLFFIRRHSGA